MDIGLVGLYICATFLVVIAIVLMTTTYGRSDKNKLKSEERREYSRVDEPRLPL